MAQRVIHIGADVKRLATRRRRLAATYEDGSQRSTPCEDLTAVIIDHAPRLEISARLLTTLSERVQAESHGEQLEFW